MKKHDNWILIVFILTFILSILFSAISNVMAETFNEVVLFILLILTIAFGVLFDVIGTAVISANEASFHALNSRRIKGAKQGLFLIKNSSRISSVCNDIVGDVCGIISGALGAMIAISLSTRFSIPNTVIAILVSAFVSSMTVGGKAIFKKIALTKADSITLVVSKTISKFGIGGK